MTTATDDRPAETSGQIAPVVPLPLIAVCNRDAALMIRHVRPHLVISITDPPPWGTGKPLPFDLEDEDLLDVLHLNFADFHEKHFDTKHEGTPLKMWAMDMGHAMKVREFLEMYRGVWQTLIVHCEAGVSRSPSMALAIAETLGVSKYSIEPVARNWDAQPLNPWVYQLTKAALDGATI